MKNFLFMFLGGLLTFLILMVARESDLHWLNLEVSVEEVQEGKSKVLYWVAPMDPNYRRDKPGKSTMGMDLVPVYAGENEGGVIEISPIVENNLGVKIATAELAYPNVQFISSGQVEFAQENIAHIHARASGWVERLYIKDVGQRVKKGQPLYGLYSLDLIDAKEDYLRALNSEDNKLVKAAKNRLRSLRVDNKVIQQLKSNKKAKQVTTFYAPQSGYVEMLNINQGMYVKPETNILSIAKDDAVVVNVEIDHQQAAWLSQFPGDIHWKLSSELMPTKIWQGELDYIRPELNKSLRTFSLRLLVDNSEKLLKPNMWLTLNGNVKGKDKVLIIPRQSLIRTENETRVVLALGEGRFKSIRVIAGRFIGQQVEIVSGLESGDRVVTQAQFLIDSESNIDSDLKRMEATHDQ